MNEYLKEYIELQKQFRETKGNPDSVRALYTFKEKLELSEDKQAKEVLVDVYDLLDFKKDGKVFIVGLTVSCISTLLMLEVEH